MSPGTVKVDVTSGHGEDSWEARMTQACQSKFAVSPRKGDAIVFYSQHPDGNVNPASLRTYRRWHPWQSMLSSEPVLVLGFCWPWRSSCSWCLLLFF